MGGGLLHAWRDPPHGLQSPNRSPIRVGTVPRRPERAELRVGMGRKNWREDRGLGAGHEAAGTTAATPLLVPVSTPTHSASSRPRTPPPR